MNVLFFFFKSKNFIFFLFLKVKNFYIISNNSNNSSTNCKNLNFYTIISFNKFKFYKQLINEILIWLIFSDIYCTMY